MKSLINFYEAFHAMAEFIISESQDCKELLNMTVIDDIDTHIWADRKPTNNAKWIYWKSIVEDIIAKRYEKKADEKLLTCDQALRAMTLYLKGKYDDDPLGLFSEVAKEINDYIQNQNPNLTKNDETWNYWLRCCEESLKYELNYD